jgi:hypothetical protein
MRVAAGGGEAKERDGKVAVGGYVQTEIEKKIEN